VAGARVEENTTRRPSEALRAEFCSGFKKTGHEVGVKDERICRQPQLSSAFQRRNPSACSTAMASAIHFGDANSGFQAGIINGPVNTEFHHHAPPGTLQKGPSWPSLTTAPPTLERTETPPNPLTAIPFSRDPDFVERGAILNQLDLKCASPGSRTALVGLGGVG
jgi:hypothetical protein